jgi:CSLREA domain-containing protein
VDAGDHPAVTPDLTIALAYPRHKMPNSGFIRTAPYLVAISGERFYNPVRSVRHYLSLQALSRINKYMAVCCMHESRPSKKEEEPMTPPRITTCFAAPGYQPRFWISMMVAFAITLLGLAAASALPPAAGAASFVVDTTVDDPTLQACTTVDDDCSLRGAIIAANADGFSDTIILGAETYTLTEVGVDDAAWDGDLDINSDLVLIGAGSGQTTIDGNGGVTGDRVIHIFGDTIVEISGVTITGGTGINGGGILGIGDLTLTDVIVSGNTATGSGGGIRTSTSLILESSEVSGNTSNIDSTPPGGGGGIYAYNSNVTITNSSITGNHTLGSSSGGAIQTYSGTGGHTLSIEDSSIEDNDAGLHGGGIASDSDMVSLQRTTVRNNDALGGEGGGIFKSDSTANLMEIMDCTINGNTAYDGGGGIYTGIYTSAVIAGSTIEGNSAAAEAAVDGGGGIKHTGPSLVITNSTISGNSATNYGGGILTYAINGGVALTNVTITGNAANSDASGGGDGGGIYSGYGPFSFANTIVAGNAGNQCAGTSAFTSIESNLSSDATCNLTQPSDLPSTPPGIGPLADNGGYTLSHAPLPGSAVVDAGHAPSCPVDDQRGWPRPVGSGCDIGAVEAPLWLFLPLIMK